METNPNQQGYDFSTVKLFKFALRKWKPLIFVPLIALVLAVIVSFQIREKYRSRTILFPVAQTNYSSGLLEPGHISTLSMFGGQGSAEKLIQVLNSNEVKQKIVQKYNLIENYKIDTVNEKYPQTKLMEMYDENIHVNFTNFSSIQVSVMDYSPETAAKIANDIPEFADTLMNNIFKSRSIQAYKIVEHEFKLLEKEMNRLHDSISNIRKTGVYAYEHQVERLTEGYASALASGSLSGANKIEEKLKAISKDGTTYVRVRDRLTYVRGKYYNLMEKYIQAKTEAEQFIPMKFVVEKAVASDKKVYPKKILIVLLTAITTFIFTFTVLMFLENRKYIKNSAA